MNEMDKAFYSFIIKIIRIIAIIYGIYLGCITIFNISLSETFGKITNIHKYEDKYYFPDKNREMIAQRKDIYYQYTVDGINYTGKRLSNMLIFPDLNLEKDDQIKIFFCSFYPKYSVLFRGNFKYTIYNLIPIIICGIIIYILKRKNNLYSDFKKENKNQFIENEKIYDENNKSDIIEMEDIFIDEIKNGEKAIKFLMVSNESDGMIIESLLKSEQVPYKIEFYSKVHSYKNGIFFILEKDYADALFILEEYIKTKPKNERDKIILYKKQYGA